MCTFQKYCKQYLKKVYLINVYLSGVPYTRIWSSLTHIHRISDGGNYMPKWDLKCHFYGSKFSTDNDVPYTLRHVFKDEF
jgi:hypothetical protein